MLVEAWSVLPPERALPGGLVMEQKPDGYRALLFARPDHVFLQSRNGADLTPPSPTWWPPRRPWTGPWSWTVSWSSSTTEGCTSVRCRGERGAVAGAPPRQRCSGRRT
ncbi:hypothetical protein [Streptomyces sp. NPDC058294]|uniref:hypothetical protein n=1 Tax=Streptomyces sp. NPDC058294 TaxID=3346430 RepID=UPI0036EB077B